MRERDVTTATTSYGALVCEQEHNVNVYLVVSDSILCRWLLFMEMQLGTKLSLRGGMIRKVTHERFSRRVQQPRPSTLLELQRSI
jgi:hypothetical protein